jgi:parallel beta-helix repeat protein
LYGISINPGSGVIVQDVQLVGVNCSGNGTSENGSGIYINGTGVSDVRIDDAVCEGSVFAIASQQQYGIYVNGASGVTIAASVATGNTSYGIYLTAVTNVTVAISELIRNSTAGISVNGGSGAQSEYVFLRSCNVTGYSPGSAIIFSGTLVVVETSNCAGYNDVGVVVATGFPSGSATYGTAFYPYQLGSTPYYGPIEFYIIAITQSGGFINAIKLSGTATQLTSGAFYVNPRETIEIDGIPPIHFLAIGK